MTKSFQRFRLCYIRLKYRVALRKILWKRIKSFSYSKPCSKRKDRERKRTRCGLNFHRLFDFVRVSRPLAARFCLFFRNIFRTTRMLCATLFLTWLCTALHLFCCLLGVVDLSTFYRKKIEYNFLIFMNF